MKKFLRDNNFGLWKVKMKAIIKKRCVEELKGKTFGAYTPRTNREDQYDG